MPAFFDRLREWGNTLWETTQVELHGHYSIEQLQRLDHYRATTSWLRAALVCLLTPVPCIIMVVLLDLLPLEAPHNGSLGSPNVWIRQWLTVFQISICTMEQVCHHLPQLALTRWQLLAIAIVATMTGVGMSFSMSLVVGYPLPFTVVVGTFPWFTVIAVLIFLIKRQQLREEPGLVPSVRRYLLVLLCQVAMTVIYPSYNFVYTRLSSLQQTAFILLLPVIKIITKNWISRTLPDTDDAKPEAVVFNVEIFHALFVSLCMGSTTSGRTIVALMVVDFVQAWLSFQDVRCIMDNLRPVAEKLDAVRARTESAVSTSRTSLQSLVAIASRIIDVEPFQATAITRRRGQEDKLASHSLASVSSAVASTWRLAWQTLSRYSISIAPAPVVTPVVLCGPPPCKAAEASIPRHPCGQLAPVGIVTQSGRLLPTDLASLNAVERGVLVRQTQKLLFIAEYIVLIEYTEVIMPLIYNTLVYAMYHLPNREYYTFLFGVCTKSSLYVTMGNVLAYGALEFVSLVIMALIVWWKLRLSVVHQLAFVLEHRTANIQAKLLLWVLDTMQTSIVQLGPDYSFRFDWLNQRHGSPPPPLPNSWGDCLEHNHAW